MHVLGRMLLKLLLGPRAGSQGLYQSAAVTMSDPVEYKFYVKVRRLYWYYRVGEYHQLSLGIS